MSAQADDERRIEQDQPNAGAGNERSSADRGAPHPTPEQTEQEIEDEDRFEATDN